LEAVYQWLCKSANKSGFIDQLAEVLECTDTQVKLALLLLRERRRFAAYKVQVKKDKELCGGRRKFGVKVTG
jgi:hypothetical protein